MDWACVFFLSMLQLHALMLPLPTLMESRIALEIAENATVFSSK